MICDDVSFAHWPETSAIHIADLEEDRGINVKHDYTLKIGFAYRNKISGKRRRANFTYFGNWKFSDYVRFIDTTFSEIERGSVGRKSPNGRWCDGQKEKEEAST